MGGGREAGVRSKMFQWRWKTFWCYLREEIEAGPELEEGGDRADLEEGGDWAELGEGWDRAELEEGGDWAELGEGGDRAELQEGGDGAERCGVGS